MTSKRRKINKHHNHHKGTNFMDRVKIKRRKRQKKQISTKEKVLAGIGVGSTLMGGLGAIAPKPLATQFVRTQKTPTTSTAGKIKDTLKRIFGITEAKAAELTSGQEAARQMLATGKRTDGTAASQEELQAANQVYYGQVYNNSPGVIQAAQSNPSSRNYRASDFAGAVEFRDDEGNLKFTVNHIGDRVYLTMADGTNKVFENEDEMNRYLAGMPSDSVVQEIAQHYDEVTAGTYGGKTTTSSQDLGYTTVSGRSASSSGVRSGDTSSQTASYVYSDAQVNQILESSDSAAIRNLLNQTYQNNLMSPEAMRALSQKAQENPSLLPNQLQGGTLLAYMTSSGAEGVATDATAALGYQLVNGRLVRQQDDADLGYSTTSGRSASSSDVRGGETTTVAAPSISDVISKAKTTPWEQLSESERQVFINHFSNGQNQSDIPVSFASNSAFAFALGLGDTAAQAVGADGNTYIKQNGQWQMLRPQGPSQTIAPSVQAVVAKAKTTPWEQLTDPERQVFVSHFSGGQNQNDIPASFGQNSSFATALGLAGQTGNTVTGADGQTYQKQGSNWVRQTQTPADKPAAQPEDAGQESKTAKVGNISYTYSFSEPDAQGRRTLTVTVGGRTEVSPSFTSQNDPAFLQWLQRFNTTNTSDQQIFAAAANSIYRWNEYTTGINTWQTPRTWNVDSYGNISGEVAELGGVVYLHPQSGQLWLKKPDGTVTDISNDPRTATIRGMMTAQNQYTGVNVTVNQVQNRWLLIDVMPGIGDISNIDALGAKSVSGYDGSSVPINPAYLLTKQQAEFISSFFPGSAVKETIFVGPFVIVYPSGDSRRIYGIVLQNGKELSAGLLFRQLITRGPQAMAYNPDVKMPTDIAQIAGTSKTNLGWAGNTVAVPYSSGGTDAQTSATATATPLDSRGSLQSGWMDLGGGLYYRTASGGHYYSNADGSITAPTLNEYNDKIQEQILGDFEPAYFTNAQSYFPSGDRWNLNPTHFATYGTAQAVLEILTSQGITGGQVVVAATSPVAGYNVPQYEILFPSGTVLNAGALADSLAKNPIEALKLADLESRRGDAYSLSTDLRVATGNAKQDLFAPSPVSLAETAPAGQTGATTTATAAASTAASSVTSLSIGTSLGTNPSVKNQSVYITHVTAFDERGRNVGAVVRPGNTIEIGGIGLEVYSQFNLVAGSQEFKISQAVISNNKIILTVPQLGSLPNNTNIRLRLISVLPNISQGVLPQYFIYQSAQQGATTSTIVGGQAQTVSSGQQTTAATTDTVSEDDTNTTFATAGQQGGQAQTTTETEVSNQAAQQLTDEQEQQASGQQAQISQTTGISEAQITEYGQALQNLANQVNNIQNQLNSLSSQLSGDAEAQREIQSLNDEIAGLSDDVAALNDLLDQFKANKAQSSSQVENLTTGLRMPADYLRMPAEYLPPTPSEDSGGLRMPAKSFMSEIATIPSATETTPAQTSPSQTSPSQTSQTYQVRKGDTLWSIAKKFYGDGKQWRKILEANPDCLSRPGNTRSLKVGYELIIPE